MEQSDRKPTELLSKKTILGRLVSTGPLKIFHDLWTLKVIRNTDEPSGSGFTSHSDCSELELFLNTPELNYLAMFVNTIPLVCHSCDQRVGWPIIMFSLDYTFIIKFTEGLAVWLQVISTYISYQVNVL